MTQETKPESLRPEDERLTAQLQELGRDIIAYTAGRDEAHLANAASAYAQFSPQERLTIIYKEEGSSKIGPEFVIQNQITGEAGSLKSLSFRWAEYYPSDRSTWGLTIIDNSLPEKARRKSIPGAAIKGQDLDEIYELVNKTSKVVFSRG